MPGGALEAHAAFDANGYLYLTYIVGGAAQSGTLTSATSTTMTDSTRNWTPGEWAGFKLMAGGRMITITSNTATTLTLGSSWTPPSAGTNYGIQYGMTGIPSVAVLESTDGGSTFSWIAYLDHSAYLDGNRPMQNGFAMQAVQAIATGPGNSSGTQSVWVLWEERAQGGTNYLYASGANVSSGGAVGSFSTPSQIYTTNPSSTPLYGAGTLAVGTSGKVAAAFQVDGVSPTIQVYVNTSGVGGSFSSASSVSAPAWAQTIKPQPFNGISATPSLAWDTSGGTYNGRLYLVDAATPYIYERYSTNDGSTWSSAVQVNDSTTGDRFLSSASIDQSTGNLAAVWYDARNDANDIAVRLYGTISTNGGASFSSNVQISAGSSNAWSAESINYSTGSNTSTTLNDTTRSWATNALAGQLVYLVWGTGAGQSTGIQSNTATQLVVNPAWGTVPDTTTAYFTTGGEYDSEFGAFVGVSFVNGAFYAAWTDNSGTAGGTAGGKFNVYTAKVTYTPPPAAIRRSGGSNGATLTTSEITSSTNPFELMFGLLTGRTGVGPDSAASQVASRLQGTAVMDQKLSPRILDQLLIQPAAGDPRAFGVDSVAALL
jgi:hypothetical protein